MTLSKATPGGSPYAADLVRWRAADGGFRQWERKGVTLAPDGALRLDPPTAGEATDPYPAGGYEGLSFYNGGSFLVGEAVSPAATPAIHFSQAIASWNADTPPGTWIEVQLSARTGSNWTRWYSMGVWAAQDSPALKRHSVRGQRDADGYVSVDTLILGNPRRGRNADGVRVKLRLFTANRAVVPSVRNAAVAVSTRPAVPRTLQPGNPRYWNKTLPVPECSQMVYPDGGVVWCSPTSLSMVLAYWRGETGPCEPRVRSVVAGVYDYLYEGHGNWPFNVAYASSQGFEGYVVRFTSLAEAEPWVAAGVPIIFSFAWRPGQLTGASISSSNGHLAVIVGFDARGNPIVNDPAGPRDSAVQRTYNRAELERLWLQYSGGTVYLIFPPGRDVPKL